MWPWSSGRYSFLRCSCGISYWTIRQGRDVGRNSNPHARRPASGTAPWLPGSDRIPMAKRTLRLSTIVPIAGGILCLLFIGVWIVRRKLPDWVGWRLNMHLPQDYRGGVEVVTDRGGPVEATEVLELQVPADGRVIIPKKVKLAAYHRIKGMYPDGTTFPGSFGSEGEPKHPLFVYFVDLETESAPYTSSGRDVWRFFVGSADEYRQFEAARKDAGSNTARGLQGR